MVTNLHLLAPTNNIELYSKYIHILVWKQNNAITNKKKQDVWQMIVAVNEAD